MRLRRPWLLALAACAGTPRLPDPADGGVFEGDASGECADGADNDRDGAYDCDDSDCAGSPDCDPDVDVDDEPDADSDTDADADADAEADPDWASFSVRYGLDWDFDEVWAFYGLEDCRMEFAGAGAEEVSSGPTSRGFDGTWERTSSDCNASLDGAVWTPPDGRAFTTLHLPAAGVLDAWVVHEGADDDAPERGGDKYYIYEMDAPIVDGQVVHVEEEDVYSDGSYLCTLTHTLEVELQGPAAR